MPCRCDGYEVEEAAANRDKLKHSEGQLCNARSLIHKLLKLVPASELDPALRTRAEQHIALLVAHKRAEYEADKAETERKLLATRGSIKLWADRLKAEQARQEQSIKAAILEEEKLVSALTAKDPSDEDLLG